MFQRRFRRRIMRGSAWKRAKPDGALASSTDGLVAPRQMRSPWDRAGPASYHQGRQAALRTVALALPLARRRLIEDQRLLISSAAAPFGLISVTPQPWRAAS